MGIGRRGRIMSASSVLERFSLTVIKLSRNALKKAESAVVVLILVACRNVSLFQVPFIGENYNVLQCVLSERLCNAL